jgi:trans-aconitate methyltransferase
MDNYKITFETWNKVAELYQDKFMDLDLYNDTYDLFCEQIKMQEPVILEIGCGPGNITKYLLNKRPDFKINAIDIAPNMIALAKKNNPQAEFTVMDSRDIDQLKIMFDGIICGFCLPYLSASDRLKLIKDCKKLLAPEGSLYISFVEGDSDQSGYQTGSSGDKTYFYYHNLEELINELKENNFEQIKIVHKNYGKTDAAADIHTIVVARKVAQ